MAFCVCKVTKQNKKSILSLTFFIADRIELGESDLKMMLRKHREKRKYQPVR